VAFCSGIFFIGQPATGGPLARRVSQGLIFSANVLGAVTLLNLGRSFGILIARRQIKTGGLYRLVRHPMYATDILLRVGFLASHFRWPPLALFSLSSACYVWRALLEERFLARAPEYREYMRRVRYRFMPGVF
jgi:protein-S-isoprenylcysteine O-methyltransferase Ste14